MKNEPTVLLKAKQGDKSSIEEIVRQNTPLVISLCKRFFGMADAEDIVEAGFEGLLKAISGFDETRGFMFSTYAVPTILGAIKVFLRDAASIKAKGSAARLLPQIKRAESIAREKLGREPRISEIAKEADLPAGQVQEAIMISLQCTSVEQQEIKEDVRFEERCNDKIFVSSLLDKLQKEDKRLIVLRYFSEKTQQQTADILGKSQVWVSRREKKILLELRQLTK